MPLVKQNIEQNILFIKKQQLLKKLSTKHKSNAIDLK